MLIELRDTLRIVQLRVGIRFSGIGILVCDAPEKSGEVWAAATIKQDFLKLSMEVHSRDSDSETLLAQPKRDAESGRPLLYYIYRVIPKRTQGKNQVPYDRAAILKLLPTDHVGLQGNYFTDAKARGHFESTVPA